MTYNFTRVLATVLLSLFALSLSAQVTVWPGDANDNGRINGADALLWSYAIGERGAPRAEGSGNWLGQEATAWQDTFPDGRTLAYADFDGNGYVGFNDLNVLLNNRNRVRPGVEDGPFVDPYRAPDTSANYTSTLRLRPAGTRLTPAGMELMLNISLTGRDTSVLNFHGITFNATFPEGALSDHLTYGQEQLEANAAINGNRFVHYAVVDSVKRELSFTFTDMGANRRSVNGDLFQVSLPVGGMDLDLNWDTAFTVTEIILYDKELVQYDVRVPRNELREDADCSFTVSPVCGINGVTYLNSCFAEAAGIFDYTAGACWNPGIVVANMDTTANCGSYYDPVCGFNGVTYQNPCAAAAAGVVDYVSGVCEMAAPDCYDPALIVISEGTSVDQATGIINLSCTSGSAPVCGCDGNEYANACLAEAAGVRNYTSGSCDAACIDPAQITNTDDCGTTQDFVCGCNDETYINACYADAAGIQNYTPGPCNGTSGWCDEATVISCGDYLPNETTIGAGNQISSYPGTTGGSMPGPDRVYVFEKTSAGDLQVGLEIMTPGLNMDMFLLTGDCGNYTVVGSSTYSNFATNNEGIVLNDAPNGTYYVVVDQRSAGVGGNYRLELSCGYLDCSQSVPLTCGTPYNGTNAGGTDDVSTYTCGPQLNVENNGPETVHTFTITEAGLVTISLSGTTANLELFLLSECSRRSCLQFSQNGGNADESITRNLPAGTYYVVVDGYNGAVSDYQLTVDCASSCGVVATPAGQTNASCGLTEGSMTYIVTGGAPVYTAHYVGPVCRSAVSANGTFTFTNLPAGQYSVTFEDGNGCQVVSLFTITSGDDGMTATLTPTDAGCGEDGRLDVSMTTPGTAPYTVYLSGRMVRTFTTNSSNFVITPLEVGNYVLRVEDAAGCSMTENFSIGQSSGNMNVTVWGEDAGCNNGLGEIVVRAPDGTLPYQLQLSGPASGNQLVNGYNFRIRSLPPGTYQIILTDAFGCSFTDVVTVAAGAMDMDVSATPANCNVPGAARVTISTGQAPYTINYNGPASGTITTSELVTVINDLPAGTYNFSVWSADGCDQAQTIRVEDNGGNLGLTVTQMIAACDGSDSQMQIVVQGGTGPYTVNYAGTTTGSMTINATGVGTLDLPAGVYTFTVTDFGNCSATTDVTINGGLSSVTQSTFLFGSGCGQQNNIRTFIGSGELPFTVTMTSQDCPDQDTVFTALDFIFDVLNVPNCTYTVSVQDANNCVSEQTITVDVDADADFMVLTAVDGACGGSGAIDVAITAGEHPFFITYTGPVSGEINLVGSEIRIRDLPAGTYNFDLTNRDGCTANESITLLNDGELEIVSSIVTDDCGAADQIWNDIESGVGPYTVDVLRLCDSTTVTAIMSGDNGFEVVDLDECCYELTVTDANGCITVSTVCAPAYQLFNPIVTDALCGQPGSIEVMVMNAAATGPYTINYTGPINGNTVSVDGQTTIDNLPAGSYVITVTGANGCTETETAVIEDIPSDLDLQTALIANDCGQYNQLWNDINGGQGPFVVTVTRICDGTIDTTFTETTNGFELTDLDECCYEVKITDALGCMVTTTTCVEGGEPNLFDPNPVSGPCGENGRIDLNLTRGQSPYMVTYTGPQSGDNTVNGNQLSINDIPAGDYTFTVTDANGCMETESVTLEETTNDLVLNAALVFNECDQYNQIWIDILNGTGPFSIEVIRLCDSTTMTSFVSGEVGFELTDLAPCDYKIIVTDAAGCMVMDVITVFPAPIDLFESTAISGECNDPALFNLAFTRGRAPYTVVLSGPVSDSIVTESAGYERNGLPSGDYFVTVTDSLGCVESEQFTLNNTTTDLDLVTSLIFNDCNQLNQLWNDINGGVGPFDVVVTRLCDNTVDTTFTTSEREFELPNRDRCDYEVKVTDATGCMDVEMTPVGATSANLFNIVPNNRCDSTGFYLEFISGSGPYTVLLNGPTLQQFTGVMTNMFLPALPGDYSIRAQSAEGCTEMSFSSLAGGGAGDLPEISFTPTVNGRVANFANTSGTGSYSWTFGDGSTSTDEDPSHTYATAGTFEVCLTVTNGCGDATSCQNVTTTNGASAQLVIGTARSFAGGSVRIPVSLQGATNVSSISGTFALSDPSLATFTRVSAGAFTPQFNDADGSFSFVASASAGVTLNDPNVNVLFFLHLDLGNATGAADINMSESPLRLEMSAVSGGVPLLVPLTYLPGHVEVSDNILGHISTQAMTMSDQSVDRVSFELSEPSGNYTLDLPRNADGIASTLSALNVGRMYYIEPVKMTDYRNGLSSFEAFLTQRYLLGFEVPQVTDPMQVVAMDMNCSQSISTTDILIMQSLLLEGNLTEVPNCNSWSFVPDSHQFPTDFNGQNVFPAPRRAEVMLENDTMVMFTAIKTGDILDDADPGRSSRELPFVLTAPERLVAGRNYRLQISVAELSELVSLQGQLVLNDGLELINAEGLLDQLQLATRERDNALRLSWISTDGQVRALNAGAGLVDIAVRARQNLLATDGLIRFVDAERFASVAHNADFAAQQPVIQLADAEVVVGDFRLLGAAPNPATDYVDVRFALPEAGEAELVLLDALGRRVLSRRQVLGAGVQQFRLDTRSLAGGAYHYQLLAGGRLAGGKLVIRR